MEEERQRFASFLAMHSHKAHPTPSPCVYLSFDSDVLSHDSHLLLLDEEDLHDLIFEEKKLNPTDEMVVWLRHQMQTYDCTKQRIVGLVFEGKKTLLSEVLEWVE